MSFSPSINPSLAAAAPTTHFAFDTFAFSPLVDAGKHAITVLNPNATSSEQTWASVQARLLCVAQAVICLVVLPFKFLFSIFHSLYTFFSGNFQDNAISSLYSFVSVGVYAMTIPMSIVMACLPSRIISEASTLTSRLLDGDNMSSAIDEFRAAARRATSDLPPSGPPNNTSRSSPTSPGSRTNSAHDE